MPAAPYLHTARRLLSLAVLLLAACGDSGLPASARLAPRASINPAAQCTAVQGANTSLHILRHEGLNLIDDYGRVVLLHGVNAVWKIAPYFPPNKADGFSAADADFLQAHGFNAVRLGVLFAGVMPKPGMIDQSYLDGVDRVLQLLAARQIYVLLDFHQDAYNERFSGEGFPPWAVYDDGLPFFSTNSFFANYFTPAVARTFDNLYADKNGLWNYYADAWAAVARRWHQQPYLLGYDLINEPSAGSQTASCASPAGCPQFDPTLQAFEDRSRLAIRAIDTAHLAWFEPQLLSQFPTGKGNFTAVNDPQTGYSWHNYACTGAFLNAAGFPSGPDCPIGEDLVFGNAETQAMTMQAASLLTEFGATDDVVDVARMVQLADKHLVGWLYWALKTWNDPTTTGSGGAQSLFAKDGDLSTVKLDKIRALDRSYPQATAGLPVALSFDPTTAAFNYRFNPAAGCGITEIHVPLALHYPHGYRVTVTGAKAISAANAGLLLLENLPGFSEVSVQVNPL